MQKPSIQRVIILTTSSYQLVRWIKGYHRHPYSETFLKLRCNLKFLLIV